MKTVSQVEILGKPCVSTYVLVLLSDCLKEAGKILIESGEKWSMGGFGPLVGCIGVHPIHSIYLSINTKKNHSKSEAPSSSSIISLLLSFLLVATSSSYAEHFGLLGNTSYTVTRLL
jgi:hypothetical protein